MSMFSVQLGAPVCVDRRPHASDALKDLIEDLFPHETEDAYLNWNGVRVALNYKYDVSEIIEGIVAMLNDLLEHDRGTAVIAWPSSSFRGTWHLSWSHGQLAIASEWEQVSGGIESALQRVATIEMPVDDFVAEWSELVRFLASQFDRLAVSPALEGMPAFQKVAAATIRMKRGLLYRGSVPPDAQSGNPERSS